MIIYCFKCKRKTETIDQLEIKSCSNRNMIKGICSVCGTRKSMFVSLTAAEHTGEGFSLNNLINNLPIEFHQYAEKGEYVPGGSFNDQQKYSFCGPGTRYEQRIKGRIQGHQRIR